MKKSVKDAVREAILPTVTELGYRIWDITYGKIGADYHLEITIDKDGGIDINDCEKVHRKINPILDELDPVEGFYYLEVSSPGLCRELKCDEHYSLSLGKDVEARLFAPKNGQKALVGKLSAYADGKFTVTCEDGDVLLDKAEISKLSLVEGDDPIPEEE